jgi:hypothetical protein
VVSYQICNAFAAPYQRFALILQCVRGFVWGLVIVAVIVVISIVVVVVVVTLRTNSWQRKRS